MTPSFGSIIDEYYNCGPVIISDVSCDYESCAPYIADFDRNSFAYCDDYGAKYHVTLTCSNLILLKKVLEYAKHVTVNEEDYAQYNKQDTLNAGLKYIGRVDSEDELPSSGKIGEMYSVGDELAVYTGEKWEYVFTSTDLKNEYIEYQCISKYKRKHKILYKC